MAEEAKTPSKITWKNETNAPVSVRGQVVLPGGSASIENPSRAEVNMFAKKEEEPVGVRVTNPKAEGEEAPKAAPTEAAKTEAAKPKSN